MKITDYCDSNTLNNIKLYDNISQMWDSCLSLYGNNIAIKFEDKLFTYKQLDLEIIKFRGYLNKLGYFHGDVINITASNTFDFVKAFMAAQTLGLCVSVLPETMTDNSLTMKEYCLDYDGDYVETYYPLKSDSALAMFTGGTTGIPKQALLSHECVMIALRNACYGYKNVFCQKYLHILPMNHVFGLIRSMLTCLYTGGTLILCNDSHALFDIAMRENPTITVLVPLLVQRGVALSKKLNVNVFGNSMETIITGAAPVAGHLANGCKELGITLCPGYGLTETACLVSGNPDMINHPDSVGLLYPDQEIRFIDNELQIKGKNIMSGYVGNVDNSFTSDGYFATGDYGYLDDDGFLYILGRKKEMILTSNGENVFPDQVEGKFKSLVCVDECELFEAKDGTLHLEVLPNDVDKYISDEHEKNKLLQKLNDINLSLPKYERASMITLRFVDFNRTKSLKKIRRK